MVATSGARLISDDAVDDAEKRAAAPGDGPDAEHPGGGDPLRACHCKRRRTWTDAAEDHRRDLRLRRALQGRAQRQRRQRPALCGRQKSTGSAGRRIDNPNTHGTGCTLSSAIAANLAKGIRSWRSPSAAPRHYISGALAAMLDLGKGSGPMNHAFALCGEFRD